MQKNTLLFGALICWSCTLSAQVLGGRHTFSFLELSPSARITGLGGEQIAIRDDEVAFAVTNPAALNASMNRHLTFNHNFFLGDIQHGYAGYAHHIPKIGMTMHGGIQYMNYGDIKQADDQGNITGTIRAKETAITVGAARPLSERFSLGLNLRFATSALDIYTASALAADVGLLYVDTARRFTAALVVRNQGAQLRSYNDTREYLPGDVQIAVSQRLKHLPFRLTVLAHHLNQWDLRYNDPALKETDVLFFDGSESADKGNPGIDNFFRHLVFSGEFLLGRNEAFRLRFGYNHLRKKELTVRSYRSLAGFSGGVGVKVNRFRIDLGYASYHLAGGVLHFGIGTYL